MVDRKVTTMAWALAMLLALAMVHLVSTTDHIVGANKGWNPNINYTDWVNNQTFVVGDWISFRYQRNQYNVLQVNQSGYDNCTVDNPIGNWSSGKDFIELNESKRYYFICGTGYCYNGMKLTFSVHETAPPPKASAHEKTKEKNNHSNGGLSLPMSNLMAWTVLLSLGALLVQ
eukprot:Gb_29238 [translate_table: standard]